MSFVQTIAFSTSRIDEMQQLMQSEGEGEGGPSEGFIGFRLLKDRDDPNRFLALAEFETYEAAMKNSERPETDAFAKKMAELCDAGPEFGNFDVNYEM